MLLRDPFLAILGGLALLAAACGSDVKPKTAEAPTPTGTAVQVVSPSPTPTATPPSR